MSDICSLLEVSLVMGKPADVVQWARDPKKPNISPGPHKYPIVRTPNKTDMCMVLKLNGGKYGHALKPSLYTIRHGWHTSFFAIREWVLEAKPVDQDKWFVLSEHSEDGSETKPFTIREKFGTCSYPLRGKFYASEYRIRQTGKNSGGYDDLYLCGIELYGKLRELDKSEVAIETVGLNLDALKVL